MTDKEIVEQLKLASDGLLVMRSEYPMQVFLWEGAASMTHEEVIQKTGHSPDTPIQSIKVDNFFSTATTEEDWHVSPTFECLSSKYQSNKAHFPRRPFLCSKNRMC
jgi:hypothetical protein